VKIVCIVIEQTYKMVEFYDEICGNFKKRLNKEKEQKEI